MFISFANCDDCFVDEDGVLDETYSDLESLKRVFPSLNRVTDAFIMRNERLVCLRNFLSIKF